MRYRGTSCHVELVNVEAQDGRHLPNDKFITSETVIELLQSERGGLPNMHNGSEYNVFFIIDNNDNLNRRSQGRRSAFDDDCGV